MFENHEPNLFLFASNLSIEKAMVLLKILHLVTFGIKMTKPNSRVVTLYDFWVLRGQKKGRREVWW